MKIEIWRLQMWCHDTHRAKKIKNIYKYYVSFEIHTMDVDYTVAIILIYVTYSIDGPKNGILHRKNISKKTFTWTHCYIKIKDFSLYVLMSCSILVVKGSVVTILRISKVISKVNRLVEEQLTYLKRF